MASPLVAAETRDTRAPVVQGATAARAPTHAAGTHADEARYAALEAQSPDAKAFRGGDVIVISASVLAVVLLVVLILVLI